jgi:hypothetical protein
MRWKEQFFVNTNEQCGLTIAGGYSRLPHPSAPRHMTVLAVKGLRLMQRDMSR